MILFFMEKGLWARETVTLLLPGSTRLWEGWGGSQGARRQLHGREWQSLIPDVAKALGLETYLLFL